MVVSVLTDTIVQKVMIIQIGVWWNWYLREAACLHIFKMIRLNFSLFGNYEIIKLRDNADFQQLGLHSEY